jgi:hypothetical protein
MWFCLIQINPANNDDDILPLLARKPNCGHFRALAFSAMPRLWHRLAPMVCCESIWFTVEAEVRYQSMIPKSGWRFSEN